MLDLDEMKQQWAEYDRKLDQSIRLNRQLLSAMHLNKARSALQRMAAILGIGAAVWFVVVAALGHFVSAQIGILRFALPAAVLDVYAIGMLAATIRLIVAVRRIDYGRPIAAIQEQLEELRVLRIRTTQWGLLGGAVVWAPFVIVTLRAFLAISNYDVAWLWVNVLFGLMLIPLAVWLSKRYGDRFGRSPLVARLMSDVAGHNLNAAESFLAGLSEFQDENVR